MLKKVTVVNATALNSGGALSILRQFLSHVRNDEIYYFFIHPSLNLTVENENVYLIKKETNTIAKRLFWDSWGLKRWLRTQGIDVKSIVSLQNTSLAYQKDIPKIIYLHQGLPLHTQKWSFLKRRERRLALYKYIYPLFIFLHVDKKTKFVVQTQWMKHALCARFKQKEENVYVIKPDILRKDINKITPLALPYQYTLFYPATSAPFKNHEEIIYALNEFKKKNAAISIGLYLTITAEEDKKLTELIHGLNLQENVHFLGPLSYEQVLIYYKSCTTVVFPSYIESFGLPLVEAAMFGKPLVAIDEDYAKEVISCYPGALFAPRNAPEKWMNALEKSFSYTNIVPYSPSYETSWEDFFTLVHEK
ncbi:glycosyltransferase [Legionella cincinnatiensis]|uniref:Glycosyltransferase, lipopolysaccharide biosynthesis protein n=1 Tax=Legionella cincinnatiensis TaxID=28085 RepID=A0A378INM0_9GAMM|nr:glycosyltransferase [Legionella cincinnatiensis]KTC92043.1 glycosyltransferase, lipopolysaccharide biosynthesis protein [Legionella cincinnatiensis]STX33654.1 glycosyltransferase, lipopolysaccharide biosynthesis protein [Legionella cincinnatiensis]